MTITIADAPAVFALNRGGFTEQLHYGFYYIKLGDSVLTNWHQSSKLQLPTRSLLKPWQFQGAGPHIESPESLLGLSSHSAQPFHLETIDRWLSELPISENQLICPPSRRKKNASTFAQVNIYICSNAVKGLDYPLRDITYLTIRSKARFAVFWKKKSVKSPNGLLIAAAYPHWLHL